MVHVAAKHERPHNLKAHGAWTAQGPHYLAAYGACGRTARGPPSCLAVQGSPVQGAGPGRRGRPLLAACWSQEEEEQESICISG